MTYLAHLGLTVHVYARGAGGAPSTARQVDPFLGGKILSYEHTIGWQFGFESMTITALMTIDEALDWLGNHLMASCVVYGPEAETVFEGYLATISATFGQEQRSVSLDGMFNRVRVRYTTVLGTPGVTATANNTTSQGLYGYKDLVLSLGESDSTEAGEYRDAMIADLAYPVSAPSTELATSESGAVEVTLTFAGWYDTLGWLVTTNVSTTKTSTTTQVGTLLSDITAANNFISTSTANIVASGVTATEYIAQDTSYRDKIETLLARGNGANPYAWGVYEAREFYASVYAGASPSTIHYQRRGLGDADLYDANGGLVRPWNVRPNRMYECTELLDLAPVATAKDSAARFFVARVTFSLSESGHSLRLEPKDSTDLAAIMVTKYG